MLDNDQTNQESAAEIVPESETQTEHEAEISQQSFQEDVQMRPSDIIQHQTPGTIRFSTNESECEKELKREQEDHELVNQSDSMNQTVSVISQPAMSQPVHSESVSNVSQFVSGSDSVSKSKWEKLCVKKPASSLILKKDDVIRYRSSEEDEWTNALVIGRAGRATGKNKDLFNVRVDNSNGEPVTVDLGSSVKVERLKRYSTDPYRPVDRGRSNQTKLVEPKKPRSGVT